MLLETQRPELQQGKLYTALEEVRGEKRVWHPMCLMHLKDYLSNKNGKLVANK